MSMSWNKMILVVSLVLIVAACKEEKPPPVERIRAVKTIVVSERASGQMRKFPGTVQPVDTSSVSFEVAGLVQEIRVAVGDRFKEGDVLAVLDKKPIALNVESAKAALSRARAQLKEKQSAYERERRIQAQDPGATSAKAVEQARAAYDSMRQAVSYSQAQLDLALRDLEKTELRAPFDGVVSARHIEPFEEVARGKPVLNLHVEGAVELAVRVPETMINQVFVGLQGEVRLPVRPQEVYHATVSEVGSVADTANAYPVKANIIDADEHVRPGMTAELTLLFAREQEDTAYLVPISALVPDIAQDDRHVYVFDAETSTVRKKEVQGKGIVGNQAIITQGIAPGDVLVVAGVSFLRDGQQVKLMNPSHAAR
jgi:RND family efflux transporter MFP subunit